MTKQTTESRLEGDLVTERGRLYVGALYLGDKMRFSTELIDQLKRDGDTAQVVTVVKIEQMPDGLKVVYLQVVE